MVRTPRPRPHGIRLILLLAALGAALLVTAGFAGGSSQRARALPQRRQPGPAPSRDGAGPTRRRQTGLSGTVSQPGLVLGGRAAAAHISVSEHYGARPVPRDFLGLSTEYWEIPDLDRHRRLFDRVLAMIHIAGDGPVLLRIGGDSADDSSFDRRHSRHHPRWAHYTLTPAFFHHAAALVRRAHVHFIIDLNTADDSPLAAVLWAAAALHGLPAGSVQALEIGNEPDLFDWWHHRLSRLHGDVIPELMRVGGVTASSYARIFGAYARVLHAAFPHIGIAGPALAQPGRSLAWQSDALAQADGAVTAVTGHSYPLSACVRRRSDPTFPTVARVLSARATSGMARALAPAITEAHQRGLPFVLTEINSVTCGGRPGVSNTFATALWAPDALFSLIHAGVQAAALHVRVAAVNAPFTFSGGSLRARPLLYGLALFKRTLGPAAVLIGTRTHASRGADLHVWALRTRGRLHVLLINDAAHPVDAELTLPLHGRAAVQWLLAHSAGATRGETLEGQHITSSGLWAGRRETQLGAVSAHRPDHGPDGIGQRRAAGGQPKTRAERSFRLIRHPQPLHVENDGRNRHLHRVRSRRLGPGATDPPAAEG